MMKTRLHVYISIFGEAFSPIELSKLTEISATRSWLKGDAVSQKSTRLRPETCWELSFGFFETNDLEEAATPLLQQISTCSDRIISFADHNGLSIKFTIVAEIFGDSMPVLFFSKDWIRLAADLSAEIEMDMYYIQE